MKKTSFTRHIKSLYCNKKEEQNTAISFLHLRHETDSSHRLMIAAKDIRHATYKKTRYQLPFSRSISSQRADF